MKSPENQTEILEKCCPRPVAPRLLLLAVLIVAPLSAFGAEELVAYVTAINAVHARAPILRSNDGRQTNILTIRRALFQTDEIQIEAPASITLVYPNGTVETATNTWKGADHASVTRSFRPLHPKAISLGRWAASMHLALASGAGGRSTAPQSALNLLGAEFVPVFEAATNETAWDGRLVWIESDNNQTNKLRLLVWSGDDLRTNVPVTGRLVLQHKGLKLFQAKLRMTVSGRISGLQLADTVQRGLGKSLVWEWDEAVAPPPVSQNLPSFNEDDFDRRFAAGIGFELQGRPAAALSQYLDLRERFPKRPEPAEALARFFSSYDEFAEIASWYRESALTMRGNQP